MHDETELAAIVGECGEHLGGVLGQVGVVCFFEDDGAVRRGHVALVGDRAWIVDYLFHVVRGRR